MQRNQFSFKTTFLTHLTVMIFLMSFTSVMPSVAGTATSITFLIDRTVEDRNALVTETQQSIDSIIQDITANGASYLGSTIKLVFADDAGEHASAWRVQIPNSFGVKKVNLRTALIAVNQNKMTTLESLRSETKVYTRSFLLEGIHRELESLTDKDKLVVVSDMCVVDNSGNNFERLLFTDPPQLQRKGIIEIHRIGRNAQSLEAIGLIEAWWNDALYRTEKFSKLYAVYQKRNANKSVHRKNRDTSTKIATTIEPIRASNDSPTETLVPSAASVDVINLNEQKMVKMSQTLRPCFASLPVGRYTFRIDVTSTGSVAGLSTRDSAPKPVVDCLRNRLSSASFAKNVDRLSYFFEETVRVGLPNDG